MLATHSVFPHHSKAIALEGSDSPDSQTVFKDRLLSHSCRVGRQCLAHTLKGEVMLEMEEMVELVIK